MKLLLVEDEPETAAVLMESLQIVDDAYRIAWAMTLQDAEKTAGKRRFHAALVDLTLPDADDCDIAHALRKADPDLPIVALTGRPFDDVAIPLARAGAQDFLQKGATSVTQVHRTLVLAIERERQRSQLRRHAGYDPMTGALSRSEFESRTAIAISHSLRDLSIGALVLLNIDNFKDLEDSLGGQAGNAVLRELARRLRGAVRKGDSIGRYGRDAFVALMEGLHCTDDADLVAEKLREECCGTIAVGSRDVRVTVSPGCAIFPAQGTSAAQLLHAAGRSMMRRNETRIRRSETHH